MSCAGGESHEVKSGSTSYYHYVGMATKTLFVKISPNVLDQLPLVLGWFTTWEKNRSMDEIQSFFVSPKVLLDTPR
jgi:hypothetical protein